jgi:c-di-GMP-binding flagellar brake protein YcgR
MTFANDVTPNRERRRERRVSVHLPIVIRGLDFGGSHFEEPTSSENLCRGGVALAMRNPVELGHSLEIRIPVLPTAASSETVFSTRGRIVHWKQGKDADESIVGVEFTGPRFHRMYVSEETS